MKKPTIKLNGGNPVNLCNECRAIVSYVMYNEQNEFVNVDGGEPKPYCEKCYANKTKKAAIKKAKAIIKSCETTEQLDIANSFLINFLNIYKDEESYNKLLEKQKQKYESLNKNE